jgi:hypothetical protein
MTGIDLIIAPLNFPAQTATNAEKASHDYGLRIGQSIQYEWFRRDGSTCRYYNQWIEFHKLRLYARGEQPIGKYKSEIAVDGDMSYLNLDWTPVPIVPKFVDIVVNGMHDRLFSVNAYAIDVLSAERRAKFQKNIETDMAAKDFLLQTQKEFGINGFNTPPDELPETDEELSLYMQLKFKPSVEVAEEEAIQTILDENFYEDIRKRVDYDLTVVGVGVVKHEFLPGAGIKVEYVDPANVVYSYTEDPYFRDCFYWGEVKQVPITELYKIKPDITKEEVTEIQQYATAWFDYYGITRQYRDDLFDREVVTLLYYNYKTTHKIVHKKKKMASGAEKVIRKEDTFNPPIDEEERYGKIEKTIDVWYEGIIVMGSNYLLKWELAKNMVRPKSASQYAMPNYVAVAPRMYKGIIESLTRRMVAFADLIQITHLKLQQVLQRVVPDGVYIDADGINEVDLGTSANYNPEDALKMYFQTGSVIGRSFTQDGEYNHAKIPIQELNSNSGQAKIQALVSTYNHYLDMLRGVTGLNEARDASTPDPNSLVGVQKLAALNSNTATRHILEGSLNITKRLAEALTCRVADVLEYDPFRQRFIDQVGKFNTAILDEIKDLYIYDFAIFIKVSPDEEEKAKLEENIQMALQRESISLEDAIDIRQVGNLKLANELLKVKRKQKEKADQQRENQIQEQQNQAAMQQQQAKAQSEMQRVQAEIQAKMQIAQAETQGKISQLQAEADLKLKLMEKEFEFNMQLKGAENTNIEQREALREKAKDKRVGIQNTQHSRLIEQRQHQGPPVNFESNEDTLDGFSLSQFDPK